MRIEKSLQTCLVLCFWCAALSLSAQDDSEFEALSAVLQQPPCFGFTDVGDSRALEICDALNLRENVKARELSEQWVRAEPDSPAAQFALSEVLRESTIGHGNTKVVKYSNSQDSNSHSVCTGAVHTTLQGCRENNWIMLSVSMVSAQGAGSGMAGQGRNAYKTLPFAWLLRGGRLRGYQMSVKTCPNQSFPFP